MWAAVLFVVGFWLLPAAWELVAHIWRRQQRRRRPGVLSPAEHALADERSSALLRDVLDDQEYQQLMRCGYLDVVSPGYEQRTYRIPGNASRVYIYVAGHAQKELCIQPVVPLPARDVIVLHKLMIAGNEEAYLARANEVPLIISPLFSNYDQSH